MVNKKKRIKVVIQDKEYTIVSDKSAAHIELVAETINKQLEELSAMSATLSKEEQAILMAVNAVSDQIGSHTKMIELEEKIKQLVSDD